MTRPYANLRVLDELFTPVDEELLALFERLHDEWGSWKRLGDAARISDRWLRYVRAGRFQTMSYVILDQMLTNLGAVGLIQQLKWYTVEEILEMGLWKEQVSVAPRPKGKLMLAVEANRRKRGQTPPKK